MQIWLTDEAITKSYALIFKIIYAVLGQFIGS